MHDFDLAIARDVPQLLDLLAENPDARLVAGATDFLPFFHARKWRPRLAVDISGIDELRYCRELNGWIEIGPLATQADLAEAPLIRDSAPALAEAAASVGDPLIRTRATMGGNICTASPAADTVPALLVLNAQVDLSDAHSSRTMPLSAFLLGPGKTALQPGEALTAIRFRTPGPGTGSAFLKLGRRQAMAISIANAAALIHMDGPVIGQARLALGAVAPTVVRCPQAEAFLAGKPPSPEVFEAAGRLAESAICPIDDVRASAAYRRATVLKLAERVLQLAAERAAARAAATVRVGVQQ